MSPPPHGGKRPGAGRKPSSTGSTQPIYMGPLEDELRARVMALPPQARKFALACLVKLAMAKTQGEFIVAFRIILREWEIMHLTTPQTPTESSGKASPSNTEGKFNV